MPSALTRRYQKQLQTIADRAARTTATHWENLGHDESDIPVFVKRATPTLTAAKASAVVLAAGYYARVIGRRAVGVNPRDVLVNPDFRAPFISYWQALKNGRVDEAVASGVLRAANMTTTFAIQSSRHTAEVVLRKHGLRTDSWSRETDAGACDWCVEVADQTYSSLDAASFTHGNAAPCNCTPVPNL